MGALSGYALPLLFLVGAPPDPAGPTEPGRPRPGGALSAEDARFLDSLVKDFLFDPKHATRVRVWPPARWVRRSALIFARPVEAEPRDGWLVKGTGGGPDRVYFTDGESIPAAGRIRSLDFEADCRRRYQPDGNNRPSLDRRSEAADREADLTNAAWLHRRGYDRLAARALADARRGYPDQRQQLRERLANDAYHALAVAFTARADTEALAHGERLLRLYPDMVKETCQQAPAIVADLKRRQKAGTFGKAPGRYWPAGFDAWPVARKVAFLIDGLDEVEGTVNPFFGDRSLTGDRRFDALVALGDAAVPALIDAAERDDRLTRCPVEQPRHCCLIDRSGRKVVTVREAALQAVREIVRVRVLDPTTEDEDDGDAAAAQAGRLRRYWARYGRLPFGERMMAILTDPAAHGYARRDAAEQLVQGLQDSRHSWSRDGRRTTWGEWPLPALARFRGPTVGEAILAALDREEQAETVAANGRRERPRAASHYPGLLAELGDPRVVPELARRAAAAPTVEDRLAFAVAADRLGAPGPLLRLARDVEAGTIHLAIAGDGDAPSTGAAHGALGQVVGVLTRAARPDADRALFALADPAHPLHALAADAVLNDYGRHFDGPWRHHPYCLAVLRALLTDTQPTGVHYYLRGDEIEKLPAEPSWSVRSPRDRVANPGKWAEHVEARVCDLAAMELTDMVVGVPEYHPLRRDADQRRADLRNFLGRHAGTFRSPDVSEQTCLPFYGGDQIRYLPEMRPLGRPATAVDVKAGRAVFHLDEKGKAIAVKPATRLVLKPGIEPRLMADWGLHEGEDPDRARTGLVVQAEVGPDGRVLYGVIFRRAVRAVRADEVERIGPPK